MTVLFAFLHHVAAFALVAGLAVELALVRGEPGAERIRRLARADMAVGISATLLLLAGLARVFRFEKGAAYYFHILLVALLSIYPTVRMVIHAELTAILPIVLFAAMMARGIGVFQ